MAQPVGTRCRQGTPGGFAKGASPSRDSKPRVMQQARQAPQRRVFARGASLRFRGGFLDNDSTSPIEPANQGRRRGTVHLRTETGGPVAPGQYVSAATSTRNPVPTRIPRSFYSDHSSTRKV